MVDARGTVKTTDREGVVVDVSVFDHPDDGVAVVALRGQLDIDTAANLRGALRTALERPVPRIVVDMSEVEFVDSTALAVLIEARSKLGNRRAFLLAGPSLETKRALEISGLDRHFSLYDSVPEALAARV